MDDEYWHASDIKNRSVLNDSSDEDTSVVEFMGTSRGEVALLSKNFRSDLNQLRKSDDTIIDEGSRPGGMMSARFRPEPSNEPTKVETQSVTFQKSAQKQQLSKSDLDLPPDRMIWRIILDQPFSLDIYKSKQQKLALLDRAIESRDGNAIIAVVLYIKNTLKRQLFHQILREKPEALDHYLSFLKSEQDYSKLSDTLSMVGRMEDVAILNYKLSLRSTYFKTKISEMVKCYKNYFTSDPSLEFNSSLVYEHISLLERQAPIDEADENTMKQSNNEIFQRFPRTASLVNKSVLTTLYYCCLYHYGLTENNLASPFAIRKAHHLTDKQFIWTAVTARARLQRWTDIDSLMLTKTLFKGSKVKFHFNPEHFIELLKVNKASREILSKFIGHIEDAELKLKLAKKCECHTLVVDLLISMKDRVQLELYKSKLLPHSTDFQYAQDALKSSTIRWKN
ncbi:Spermatoproteinsis-defective protein 39 [Chamberlinius hualienensis]